MRPEEPSQHSYKKDYSLLELDDRADWPSAQASYRRLVHLWHPDKFESRPRERAHAQQQFIALTKSFNALRSYHRLKQRLPYESIHSQAQRDEPAESSRVPYGSAREAKQTPESSDSALQASSLTGRSEKRKSKNALFRKHRSGLLWAVSGGALMMATVAFFLIQDRKANQAIMEQGREVVRQAAPSDFMPSAAEIRKSQTRGAFVKPPN